MPDRSHHHHPTVRHNTSSSRALELTALSYRTSDTTSIPFDIQYADPATSIALLVEEPPRSTSSPDDLTTNDRLITSSSQSYLSRIWHVIMSHNPLLMRSSPALGTGSYGALPSSPTKDDAYARINDHPTKRRRKSVPQAREDSLDQEDDRIMGRSKTTSSEYNRKRSSSGTDRSVGLDASFIVSGDAGAYESHSESSTDSEAESEDTNYEIGDGGVPDNSPYAEVRASVPPTDNISLSINTPRMWVLSLLFAIAGSATNLFFSLRYPSVAITPVIALVLVHPLGSLWDMILKRKDDLSEDYIEGARQMDDRHGQRSILTRTRLWLAQGQWNEKEHACVYISSNVSFGFAFATDVIVEQHKFYNQEVPIMYQLLLTISTQILGYAFAGLTRRFLVRPAAMIWPGTLMSTAMFSTMHKQENKTANGWSISRYRFFVYVWAGAFAWYFLPGLLIPALSYFNVITWFAPKNVVVSNLVSLSPSSSIFLTWLVWRGIRFRSFSYDLRLGTDCLYRFTAAHSLVGSCERYWRACTGHVDHCSPTM